jgi:hypothetical protein
VTIFRFSFLAKFSRASLVWERERQRATIASKKQITAQSPKNGNGNEPDNFSANRVPMMRQMMTIHIRIKRLLWHDNENGDSVRAEPTLKRIADAITNVDSP